MMQQREEVQPEKVLEQEEGELSQEELPKTSNENGESIPNNNNINAGEMNETTSAEIIKQQQIDKPLCRYFLRGVCRYGDNCRFSHDDQSQQNQNGQGYQNGVGGIVSNVVSNVVSNGNGINNEVFKYGVLTHPRSSTPCRFFAKGYCRYGDDCKFSHIVIPNGNIVHHPHNPQYAHYQQQPYDWNGYPQDGDNNNVIKPWDEDSQEVLDAMHQPSYY